MIGSRYDEKDTYNKIYENEDIINMYIHIFILNLKRKKKRLFILI